MIRVVSLGLLASLLATVVDAGVVQAQVAPEAATLKRKGSVATGPGEASRGQGLPRHLAGVEPAPDTMLPPPRPRAPGPLPESQGGRLRTQGDSLARLGKCVDALPLYREAIALDPFDRHAFDGAAYCTFSLGQHAFGSRLLSSALRDNPDYHRGWLALARLRRAAGDPVGAVGAYRRYLAADGRSVIAQFELGRTLRTLGRRGEAVTAYEEYLAREDRREAGPAIVAAHRELRALGVNPLASSESTVATTSARASSTSAPASGAAEPAVTGAAAGAAETVKPGAGLTERPKTRAELAAEARRQAAEERRARAGALRQAAEEKRSQEAETRRQAADAKRLAAESRPVAAGSSREVPDVELARAVGQDMATRPAGAAVAPRAGGEVMRKLVAVADDLFARRHYVVALGIYQQAARAEPSEIEPLYKAGLAAMAANDMVRAAELFNDVLRLDPGSKLAELNLKLASSAAGDKHKGRGRPAIAPAALAEVRAEIRAARYARAEERIDALLARGEFAQLYLLRAEARLGQEKYQGALDDGARALALAPELIEALRVMGDAHRNLRNRDRALFYFRSYLNRSSSDEAAAKERAGIEQAISDLSRAP